VNHISQLAGSRTPLAYLDTLEEYGEKVGGLVFAWRARSSQLSGSLCCGRRWHFRKPALSTDKFKLKVTSRSYLYIYTLNVSCIMLVYYFVPFIVSNRYLLFWVSNGHNSVTVQNWTHVYMNLFHHKDLGNHLLQLCPKVVKHPVLLNAKCMCWYLSIIELKNAWWNIEIIIIGVVVVVVDLITLLSHPSAGNFHLSQINRMYIILQPNATFIT